MNKNSFGSFNKDALIDNFNDHLKDDSFKQLIKHLDVDKNILIKHTSNLEITAQELNNCKNCKSLNFCQNKLKGYIFYPSIYGNTLKFNYIACKKQKEYLNRINTNADYIKMPVNLKEASMKDIYAKY